MPPIIVSSTLPFLLLCQRRDTILGDVPISGLPWHMSGTPGSYDRAAPCLGEHNDYVYRELLGLSAEEIVDYTEQGIFH